MNKRHQHYYKIAVMMLPLCLSVYPATAQLAKGDPANAALDNGNGNGLGVSAPQVTLRSGIAGEEISLTIGTQSASWENLKEEAFSLTFNAPFNKKKNIGTFLTQAGLPGTWSATVGFSQTLIPAFGNGEVTSSTELTRLSIEARTVCNANLKPDSEKKKCTGDLFEVAELIEKFNRSLAAEVKAELHRLENVASNLDFLGLNLAGSVGRDIFEFRNPLSFAESSSRKVPVNFTATLGWIPNISKPWGFFGGGQYKRAFKLPDEETRCPIAPAGAVSVTCITAAFSGPVKDIDATTFAAVRFNSKLSKKIPVSAELKFAYDWDDNDWGASLPIYFFQNKDNALNGGFRVDYEHEKRDFSFGVFIGTTFDFLKL